MDIYTRTGDSGLTTLKNAKNISKSDDRIQLLGTIDELTSHLGLIKADAANAQYVLLITAIQNNLMTIMAGIADPFNKDYKLKADEVIVLENEINHLEELFPREKEFIIPGGCAESARIDIARTVARRAERCLITVDKKYGGDSIVKQYMNRLADYLYIIGRYTDYKIQNKQMPTSAVNPMQLSSSENITTGGSHMLDEEIIQKVLQKLSQTDRINLEYAKKLIEKIEQYCKNIGLNSVITVCGPDGNTIAVHVMDGAYLASFDISIKKAYTAVAVKMSTLDLGKLAIPGGTFYGIDKADNGRMIIFGGGIPLVYNNRIIGGLGISGGTGEQDHEAALFGLSILEEIL